MEIPFGLKLAAIVCFGSVEVEDERLLDCNIAMNIWATTAKTSERAVCINERSKFMFDQNQ
jgi:hypothetical protein